MNEPVFKKESLCHFAIVDEPGTYIVKSANSTYFEDGTKSRYLLNLRATTIESLEHIEEVLGNRDECPYSELNGCFLTGVVWENRIQSKEDVPTRGESVIATYDLNEDGDLVCTAVTLRPRRTLRTYNPKAYNTQRKLFNQLKLQNE